jgi:hypothetical protein
MSAMRGLPEPHAGPRLAVIIPSTGRAERCARLVERIYRTAATPPTVVVSVERKDVLPYSSHLTRIVDRAGYGSHVSLVSERIGDEFPGASHVAAMNRAARGLFGFQDAPRGLDPKMIVKMDDDHWPVTPAWDRDYLAALDRLGGTGVVYGNDLHQGEKLPTVPGISTDMVRELGWYAPPQLGHLYCDNFWLELGKRSGKLAYMPDVIIEHRHPQAGKAERDRTYAQGGESSQRWSDDKAAWERICKCRFDMDISQIDLWAAAVRGLAERRSGR